MEWGMVSAWTLWAFVTALALVLYLRVDARDWGMIGMTVVMAGAWVLLSRTLLVQHGHDLWRSQMLTTWRLLVLIGAPVAVVGFVAGMVREPPPRRRVIIRLALLSLVLVAMMVAFQSPGGV